MQRQKNLQNGGKKHDLCDFTHGMGSWDFHTQQSVEFTLNGMENNKNNFVTALDQYRHDFMYCAAAAT